MRGTSMIFRLVVAILALCGFGRSQMFQGRTSPSPSAFNPMQSNPTPFGTSFNNRNSNPPAPPNFNNPTANPFEPSRFNNPTTNNFAPNFNKPRPNPSANNFNTQSPNFNNPRPNPFLNNYNTQNTDPFRPNFNNPNPNPFRQSFNRPTPAPFRPNPPPFNRNSNPNPYAPPNRNQATPPFNPLNRPNSNPPGPKLNNPNSDPDPFGFFKFMNPDSDPFGFNKFTNPDSDPYGFDKFKTEPFSPTTKAPNSNPFTPKNNNPNPNLFNPVRPKPNIAYPKNPTPDWNKPSDVLFDPFKDMPDFEKTDALPNPDVNPNSPREGQQLDSPNTNDSNTGAPKTESTAPISPSPSGSDDSGTNVKNSNPNSPDTTASDTKPSDANPSTTSNADDSNANSSSSGANGPDSNTSSAGDANSSPPDANSNASSASGSNSGTSDTNSNASSASGSNSGTSDTNSSSSSTSDSNAESSSSPRANGSSSNASSDSKSSTSNVSPGPTHSDDPNARRRTTGRSAGSSHKHGHKKGGRRRGRTSPRTTPYKNPLGDFKIVCLFNNKKFYKSGLTPAMIDSEMCTHLNYEFAILDPKTFEIMFGEPNLDVQQNFVQEAIDLKKKDPRLKVLLSVGGWDDSTKKYSQMADSASLRANFVTTAVAFLKKHEFDGLDLAWEYPNCWQGAIGISPKDKPNFVYLLEELRNAFKAQSPALELTVSVGAIKREIIAAYQVDKISELVDGINVMTYDMHGPWEPRTGHHTQFEAMPGDPDPWCNTKGGLQVWLDYGADKKKLMMGIALYGKCFTLADPNNYKLGAPAKGIGNAGPVSKSGGFLLYSEICDFLNNGNWTEEEDKHAGYYAHYKNQWACYDPPMMMVKKAKYVVEQGLGGVLLKDLGGDDYKGSCLSTSFPLTKMTRMEMIHRVKRLNKSG